MPHHDRVEVARQHERGVAHRLAARQLRARRCAAASRARRAARCPTSNETRVRVEGFSNSSATLRRRSGSGPSRPASFSSSPRLSRACELAGLKLGAGDEVLRSGHSGILRCEPAAPLVEPLPRPRRAAQRRSAHAALAVCCGRDEHDDTHVQVNRSLRDEFAALIAARWSVCLLQEAPPSWERSLARRRRRYLVSRAHVAQLARVRAPAARPLEPGPDGLLGRRVEPHARAPTVADRRPGPRPAAQPAPGTRPARTPAHVVRAAARASDGEVCVGEPAPHGGCATARGARGAGGGGSGHRWAGATPLVLGGDFNLRPAPYARCSTSSSAALRPRRPHLAGCDRSPARAGARGRSGRPPPGRRRARELEAPGGLELRRLRLSDHAPIEATYGLPAVR